MLICDTICTTYYVDVGNLEEKVFTNLVSKTRSGREEQCERKLIHNLVWTVKIVYFLTVHTVTVQA
jgi:hypothetical protein